MGLVAWSIRFDSDSNDVGVEGTRFDAAELRRPERTPEGFLRGQADLTRVGVFEYQRPDGSKFREFRAPDEVFSKEALASFSAVPITVDHPPELLSPATVRQYQVGQTGSPVQAGTNVRADILLTDQNAIDTVLSGKNKLSCGYRCKAIQRSGEYTDDAGNKYRFDAVQTNIRGNHLAIVTKGTPRAGDGAQIRIDSNSAEMIAEVERTDMKVKITIGGQEFEVDAEVADALKGSRNDAEKARADGLQTRVDALTADLAKVSGELSASKGALDALKAEQTKPATDAARMDAEALAFETRLDMILKASPILGKPVKDLVHVAPETIVKDVVSVSYPKLDLEGKDASYLRSAFDIATEKHVDTTAALRTMIGKTEEVRADSKVDPIKKIHDQYSNAWKTFEAAK